MTETRDGSPVLALLVYAALGVAIGLIAWAVLLHDASSTKPDNARQTHQQGERK